MRARTRRVPAEAADRAVEIQMDQVERECYKNAGTVWGQS